MLVAKASVARIAARIVAASPTIYREIGRNRFDDDELPELCGYYGVLAQRKAAERRRRLRKLIRMPDLLAAIVDRLRSGWSPEQIAGRLRFGDGVAYVCHEIIYAHVYSKDAQDERLARWLPEPRPTVQARHGGTHRRARGPALGGAPLNHL